MADVAQRFFSLVESINNDTLYRTVGNGNISLGAEIVKEREHSSLATSPPQHVIDKELSRSDEQFSLGERVFWFILFSVMVLIAVGGNTIVVYIVSTNREMKSVTNYFLVNLSLADTMVSTLNVIFSVITMLNRNWAFGQTYCAISNFISILSISASVFTLTAISCDRYKAILHPLQPRMSHRRAISWILLIWFLSSMLAMPNAIFSKVYKGNNTDTLDCKLVWPDQLTIHDKSSYDNLYNFIILIVTYLVPILTMAILYYKVGKELWGYQAIGENIDKQKRALQAKKKIVKMMIVVVIIFALCWLPYHAYFLVSYYLPEGYHYERLYLFMYWLAMSNSMYNPIIIYFMNSKFRHEFRKILCFLFLFRVYTPAQRSTGTKTYNFTVTTDAQMTSPADGGSSINGGGHRGRLFVRKTLENGSDNDDTKSRITLLAINDNNDNSKDIAASRKNNNNSRPLTATARATTCNSKLNSGAARAGRNQLKETSFDGAATAAETTRNTGTCASSKTSQTVGDLTATTSVTSNSKPTCSEKLADLVNGRQSSTRASESPAGSNVSRHQDQSNNNKVWI